MKKKGGLNTVNGSGTTMAAVNTLNMYTLMRGFYLNHVSSQNT